MNVYDFDKTIYKKDSSIKFFLYCLTKKPILFFHLVFMFVLLFFNKLKWISTKNYKEKYFSFLKKFNNVDDLVTQFWKKEIENVNAWYYDVKQDDDVICSASPEFLVKGCMSLINENAIVVATKMEISTGKIDGENCKGEEKCLRIKSALNLEGDVVFENAYTDSLSDFPMLDLAKNKYIVCGKKCSRGGGTPYKFGEQKIGFFKKIKYYFKLIRLPHYVKNGLVLVPLFFSKNIFNTTTLLSGVLGFLSFCFISSFVYIVNDLADVKKDRQHSTKRKRPIASYMVKPWEVIIIAIIFLCASVCINIFALSFNWLAFSLLIFYAMLNLLYSFALKNVAIVDVFVLSGCYILRVLYGGVVCSVPVSIWLYLTVLSASLFMGYGKRRNEITKEKSETRKVNKNYNYNFLDKNAYLCMTLTLVFYSVWAYFATREIQVLNKILIMFSVILVYFIMMKYSKNIETVANSGNPIEVLIKDRFLIFCVVLYLAIIFVALYYPINFDFWGLYYD